MLVGQTANSVKNDAPEKKEPPAGGSSQVSNGYYDISTVTFDQLFTAEFVVLNARVVLFVNSFVLRILQSVPLSLSSPIAIALLLSVPSLQPHQFAPERV